MKIRSISVVLCKAQAYDEYYVLDWVAKSLYRPIHTKEFSVLSNSVLLINPFLFPAAADGRLPMLGVYL